MRIVLDARYLKDDFSGIGVYSRNLIEAIGRVDQENEYIVITHESFTGNLDLPDNFEILEDEARPVSIRTLTTLANTMRRLNPDILHSLMPLVPIPWRGRMVNTVFDLQPLLDPHFTSGRPLLKRLAYDYFYRIAYRQSIGATDYTLCISYATKRDVTRTYPEAADKLVVIHAGYDASNLTTPSEEQIAAVREKFNLPERFLFYLGSTRPNKNLPLMADAFEEFIRRQPEHDDLHWVMVLNPDRFFDPLFASIRRRGLLRRIQIHEQVTEAEKRVFYHEAALLYFVTRYEGFGLPVLEAQGSGLPVLASTHSSLPEVAGTGAILVNPDSRDAIVAGLEQFFGNSHLVEELVNAGQENLRRFSWDTAARETVAMYEHLLS